MTEIAGFWSYVHDDNKSVSGAIVKLAERLISEFELLSAEPLRLFVDRDIQWGEAWRDRIDKELQQTTFFIPIITPRYFQSDECRRELVEFKTAAARFEVSQLLLPIYYVTVPEMDEPDPQDELMAYVKKAQRADMRETRLAEEMDATYRRLVNGLATRLLQISRETEGIAGPVPEETSPMLSSVENSRVSPAQSDPLSFETLPPREEEENQDGSLDKLAAGEGALAAWATTIEELSVEIEALGEAAAESTPEMEAADSFAKQLSVANSLAKRLEEPSQNIARIAQDYSTHLLTVDPAVQQLIENARENDKAKEELEDLFMTLLGMISAAREGTYPLVELANGMETVAGVSRELRPPVRRTQIALRNIRDGQKVLDSWESQIKDLFDAN